MNEDERMKYLKNYKLDIYNTIRPIREEEINNIELPHFLTAPVDKIKDVLALLSTNHSDYTDVEPQDGVDDIFQFVCKDADSEKIITDLIDKRRWSLSYKKLD